MAPRNVNHGKESTAGRSLMSYVASKLPYAGLDILDTTDELNPKYKYFNQTGISRPEALSKHSVSQSNDFNETGIGNIKSDSKYGDMMYANIQKNKGARLQDYRVMSAFSEISNALDEICDETINKDSEDTVARLKFVNEGKQLDDDIRRDLESECQKYLSYYELDEKGWTYFRDLLIEGEVYFEHIIHEEYADKGVLGVVKVATELIDPVYSNIQNMLVKGFIYRKPKFDPNNPTAVEDYDMIPMEENQVSYFHSGIWNENKTIRIPFIENARRAYRQLTLIEDAIVIYRLVRAPERLVFNVDTGTMAPPKAEQYLRKLMQQYWSSKTFDVNQDNIVNKFNPQSMLDSFWFAKRQGSEGTTVSQLAGGQNLGELTDLLYFVKKLYKALKVPVNRVNDESVYSDGSDILREELKFARFIIRMQMQFAKGLKKGFKTHLKFTGKWKKYDLNDTHFNIELNVPTNFYELRESQRFELKAANYNSIAGNESVSDTYAQKKYLGWDDQDVLANRQWRRKDADFEWEIQQRMANGPGWKEALGQPAEGDDALGGAPFGGGGGGGGLGAAPPSFGGGPADADADGGGDAAPPVDVPVTPAAEPAV